MIVYRNIQVTLKEKFTYLFNMNNFIEGYYIDDIKKMSKTNFSNFKDIIDDIYKKT